MINTYIYLSHFLDEDTVIYGGERSIKINKVRDLENGDTANTKTIFFHNHSGTHIDFPNHFINDGLKSDDYDANYWNFSYPFLINLPCNENCIIIPEMISIDEIPIESDFIIIKTGFEKYRGGEKYWKNNPGLSPDLSQLLKKRCPNLKIIGMDFISITSFQNRELGRIAHKNFLGENLLLIEDMHLTELTKTPIDIVCLPLLMSGLDGAPITIIAKIAKT